MIFRPSAVVNFKLMFDDALHPISVPSPVTVDSRVRTPPRGGANRPSQQATMFSRSDEDTSWIYARIPKRMSVEDPGFRQAGKFDMTLDFRDLPIDPRTVRSAAVEIHMGAVSHGDFGTGMVQVNPDGSRSSIISTRKNGAVRQDTLRMIGLVDEWQVDEADNGAEVTLSGRDLRGPLLDTPLGTDPSISQQILGELDLSQPIDQVVTQLLRYNPLFDLINVKTNEAEWDNETVPAPRAADLIPRHRQGANGQRTAGRASMPGDSNQMSFWDLIVQLCFIVGAVPFFRGESMLIRPARSIYDQQRTWFNPDVQTPFVPDQPRHVQGVDGDISIRWLVYGRDAQKLHFSRKFGGFQRPKTVRCVSINPDGGQRGLGQVVQAQWPPAASPDRSRTNRVSPSARLSQEEVLTIPVHGISDVGRLQSIAQNLYEQISRLEMGGTASTPNLASFGGDNDDPDLLRLRPGDGVIFYTDVRELRSQQPLVSTVTDHYRTPFEGQVDEIASRIGDRTLAAAIVASARGQSGLIQRAFRVSTVKLEWDAQTGIGIEFDFQNYYEPRAVSDSAGTARGSVHTTTTTQTTQSGNSGNIGHTYDTFFTTLGGRNGANRAGNS
jgi:hypothetical protein